MAEKGKDEGEGEEAKPAGKKKNKLLFLILGGLGIASVAGTALFMTGVLGHKTPDPEQSAEAQAPVKKTPIYYPLEKPVTVNFETESGLRFLQVELEVMTYDPVVIENVKMHMPVIRHQLIEILSSENYGNLVTADGKTKIQQTILNKMNDILKDRTGKAGIEDVYFTNFVIQ